MLRLFSGAAVVRLSGAGAQLLMTVLITRVCGADVSGAVFFGYALAMILSTLARAGTELSGLREVAHISEAGKWRQLHEAVATRLAVVSVLSAAAALMLIAVGPTLASSSFGDQVAGVVRWSAMSIPAFALIGLLAELFKAVKRALVALALQNFCVPALTAPVIALASVWTTPTAAGVSAAICATAWVVALSGIVLWIGVGSSPRDGLGSLFLPTLACAKQLIRDAPILLVVSATPVLMQWIGATALGFLAAPADVAGYSVAARISIVVSVVHSAASSVVAPHMAIAHSVGDRAELQTICIRTGAIITAITWPLLVLMLVFSKEAMGIFGDEFREFAPVLRILLMAQMVAAVIGHSGMVLVMSAHYREARLTSIIAAVTLGLLSFALIPFYGPQGAAMATSSAIIIGHLAGLLLVRRTLGILTVPSSYRDLSSAIRRSS